VGGARNLLLGAHLVHELVHVSHLALHHFSVEHHHGLIQRQPWKSNVSKFETSKFRAVTPINKRRFVISLGKKHASLPR